MRRAPIVALALVAVGLGATVAATAPRSAARRAWPLRAHVSGAAGGPAPFRAVAAGGAVLVTTAGSRGESWRPGGPAPVVAELAPGDTLRGTAPAQFPVDPRRGSLTFLAAGAESLEVVVTHNGGGALPVTARGQRLVIEASAGLVRVRAQ